MLTDPEFAKEMGERQGAWRNILCLVIEVRVNTPGMSASLGYFDTYRQSWLSANLLTRFSDCIDSYTYEREVM
ncbi:6-phosphogluconate dehydrogenase, decarboxylating 2-like [Physcomitrium patens]